MDITSDALLPDEVHLLVAIYLDAVHLFAWPPLSIAPLLALYAAFVIVLVIAGRRESAHALARFIPDCVVLCSRLLRDPRVPRRKRALLAALAAYLALPFDLVPDFIPVAG